MDGPRLRDRLRRPPAHSGSAPVLVLAAGVMEQGSSVSPVPLTA